MPLRFASFKQPIRKRINALGGARGDQALLGFNKAQDVLNFHTTPPYGNMHPIYVPDLKKKDKHGFCLIDKFPHLIGEVPVDKGMLNFLLHTVF